MMRKIEFSLPKNTIFEYIKDKNNRRIGCVVALVDKNEIYIGWSRCHTKKDIFDKNWAYKIAVERAIKCGLSINEDTIAVEEMPIRDYIIRMQDRAKRYFKQVKES